MSCDLTAYIQKSAESQDDDADRSNTEIVIQIQIQVNQDTEHVSYIPYLYSQTNYQVPALSEAEMEQANYEHRRNQAIENGNSYQFDDTEFMKEMEGFVMQNGHGSPQVKGKQYFGGQVGGGGPGQGQQDFFEDYEWMVEMDKFDEDTMRQIEKEEDDDIDDMFWWNPDAGCEAAPSTKKEAKATAQTTSRQDNRPQRTNPRYNSPQRRAPPNQAHNPQRHHQHTNRHPQHPQHAQQHPHKSNHQQQQLSFNPLAGAPASTNGYQTQQYQRTHHTFNPLAGQSDSRGYGGVNGHRQLNGNRNSQYHHRQQATTAAMGGEELAAAMGGVDINKFHLNPDATSFVPSWLKK